MSQHSIVRPWVSAALLLALGASSVLAEPTTQPAPKTSATTAPANPLRVINLGKKIVIDGTLEASMDYPRVQVQLKDGERVLTAEPTGGGLGSIVDITDLNNALDGKAGAAPAKDEKYEAFLDTGASAHVLSKATAARFGVEQVKDAVYHEVGLNGQTGMGVSKPYELSIGPLSGALMLVDKKTTFQINQEEANPLIEMAMGEVNIIGMPAIRKFVVEITTGPVNASDAGGLNAEQIENLDLSDLNNPELVKKMEAADAGPVVTLHEGTFKPAPGEVDFVIPLEYANFSRRKNPDDKGPLPALADNPTVKGVSVEHHGKSYTGTWLLDTGAPTNMICTKQAQALGLMDKDGKPTREPDFYLPLGGIGGKVEPTPGFRVEKLVIPGADGKSLEYRRVYVMVSDVSTKLDSGETVTLDGILGTALWFPTVAGVASGFPTDAAPSAFTTVWIDGPGGKLMLKLLKR
jgi:hypothetical protein